ncbi:HNH endonuclease [Peribacillus simplex]|uniref:HNH endonuclease n=1 Tax=Peribacillus simplex TaxID=1478 RepID=UPI000B266E8F|nr:HNH endonuclease signature motif containing protein [Peribacillus simplex]
MLYFLTASDPIAYKNFEKTIQKPYPIKDSLNLLDPVTIEKLKLNNSDKKVRMWGAKPGPSNLRNWNNIKEGDSILAYSRGEFLYYGKILCKKPKPNQLLAKEVWGTNKDGETWEYIFFIKDLTKINIDKRKFNSFFEYGVNNNPFGFGLVKKENLERKLKGFKSIDDLIYYLKNEYVIADEELEDNSYQDAIEEKGFSNIEVDITPEPKSKKKPKTIRGQKVWTRDPVVAKRVLKKAEFKCEINSEHLTFISNSTNTPYMEAHHLIPMKYQDEFPNSVDVDGNVVCLCPNCHRKIHHGTNEDKKELIQTLYTKRFQFLQDWGIFTP